MSKLWPLLDETLKRAWIVPQHSTYAKGVVMSFTGPHWPQRGKSRIKKMLRIEGWGKTSVIKKIQEIYS
jgi:hypothetical protein